MYEDLIRLYLRGLLAARGGDNEAARAYADQREARQADWEGDAAISVHRTTPNDLAQGVRADGVSSGENQPRSPAQPCRAIEHA